MQEKNILPIKSGSAISKAGWMMLLLFILFILTLNWVESVEVKRQKQKWEKIIPGMSLYEVKNILGEPRYSKTLDEIKAAAKIRADRNRVLGQNDSAEKKEWYNDEKYTDSTNISIIYYGSGGKYLLSLIISDDGFVIDKQEEMIPW